MVKDMIMKHSWISKELAKFVVKQNQLMTSIFMTKGEVIEAGLVLPVNRRKGITFLKPNAHAKPVELGNHSASSTLLKAEKVIGAMNASRVSLPGRKNGIIAIITRLDRDKKKPTNKGKINHGFTVKSEESILENWQNDQEQSTKISPLNIMAVTNALVVERQNLYSSLLIISTMMGICFANTVNNLVVLLRFTIGFINTVIQKASRCFA